MKESKTSILKNDKSFMDIIGKENDRTVGKKFGCSHDLVYKIRKEYGISPSRKHMTGNKRKLDIDLEQLEDDIIELGTQGKVAKKYKCSRQAISIKIKMLRGDKRC